MATFASRLRELREERGWTQPELGKRVGLSKQAISSYENGGSHPGPDLLLRFAEMFGVSVDYLMGRSNSRREIGHDEPVRDSWGPEGWRMIRRAGRATPEKKELILRLIETVLAEGETQKK